LARRDAPPGQGYARSRERDDAIRAGLEPLAPGERPLALRVSALLAALIAAGNLVAVLAGVEVDGRRPVAAGLGLAVLMAGMAVGLWRKRYLVVLLWQALLGVALVYAALSLMLASNTAAVIVCVAVLAVAGSLFWFLVGVMARMQAPPR
jgi:hypothetical protein